MRRTNQTGAGKRRTSGDKIGKRNQIPLLTAFLSDVHSNLPALEAAVADAKKRGAQEIYCAGDLTGYGPFPEEVCQYLRDHAVRAISGNYDKKVLTAADQGTAAFPSLSRKKQEILLWTAEHLSGRSRHYLKNLPERLELDLPGGLKALVVHGSRLDNDGDILPSVTPPALQKKLGGERTDVLICGHTHIPFVKRVGGVLVVNCGSCGQPVDGDTRPAYALLRAGEGYLPGAKIVRFNYDLERTLQALKESGLPKGLRRDYALGSKRMFLQ